MKKKSCTPQNDVHTSEDILTKMIKNFPLTLNFFWVVYKQKLAGVCLKHKTDNNGIGGSSKLFTRASNCTFCAPSSCALRRYSISLVCAQSSLKRVFASVHCWRISAAPCPGLMAINFSPFWFSSSMDGRCASISVCNFCKYKELYFIYYYFFLTSGNTPFSPNTLHWPWHLDLVWSPTHI